MIDDRNRAESILDELLDLPPDKRASRLGELCSGDDELRDEVRSLLRAYERSEDFLERPMGRVPGDDPARNLSGTRIADYELLDPVGHGGMGDVYLARRASADYEQRVAVKVMRGAALDPETMLRFRTECRVLAQLDHPNIAHMIEGAVADDGTPYIVMEYVRGRPIDAYCDESGLGVRERVRLLREVSAAVNHLHQHSTIHRDLKASNVLVTEEGRVKLIDFGIARVLDSAESLTVAGLERMTPSYASPEQLRGEGLTTATDVYSLGVLAYRVLTGRLPYEGSDRYTLEREITGTGPPQPSAAVSGNGPRDLAQRLKGDLDTIVLTAMHPVVERRYASVEQFDEDLRRHLQDLPVLARPDSWRYAAGKFVRRHALAVGAAAAVALVLAGSAVVGFGLYGRAERARVQAEEIGDFLAELLATANPLSMDSQPDLTVREALDVASRRVDEELQGQPSAAASLHLTIGLAYRNLGLLDDAEVHFLRVEELADQGDASADRALVGRGGIALARGDYVVAESLMTTAIEPGPHRSPDARAAARLGLSRICMDLDRLSEAANHARLAVREGDDADATLRVRAVGQLGAVRRAQGDYAAAESLTVAAIELASTELGENHVLVGWHAQNLGVFLDEQGRLDEAIAAHERALRTYEKAYPPGHLEFAVTLTNLADVEAARGRPEIALEHYGKARRITAEHLGPDHLNWAMISNGMAFCEQQLGRLEMADSLYTQSIEVIGGALGRDHPWNALVRGNQARLRLEQGRPEDARNMAGAALRQLEESLAPDHIYLARPLVVLAEIDLATGEVIRAGDHVARLDRLTAELAPDNPHRLRIGVLLARCLAGRGDIEAARAVTDSLGGLIEAADSVTPLVEQQFRELRSELDGG